MPGVLKEEQYNLPIEPGFSKYPADNFEFIVGSAEAADLDAKTVRVVTATGERSLSYDHLVLGTGTRYMDANSPWKANGTNEEVMARVRTTQEKIRAAQHIVIAGAGATGVETAGEIRYEFKDKTVVLLSSGDQILGGDAIAGNAESELLKLGVQVKLNARVKGAHEMSEEGKTEVHLENGETILTDFYMPTMGVLPNTDYLPAKVLRNDKYVLVDEFGRVKNAENVWAAGDIISEPKSSFIIADKQVCFLSLFLPISSLRFDYKIGQKHLVLTISSVGCRCCQEHRPRAKRQEDDTSQTDPRRRLRLRRRPQSWRRTHGWYQGLLFHGLHDQGQDVGHADAARHRRWQLLLVAC